MTDSTTLSMLNKDYDPYEEDAILKRYKELCAIRDQRNEINAPLQSELNDLNETIESLNRRTKEIAAQMEKNWGNESWIKLKRQIAVLAKLLGRPDGPLATK